MDIKCVLCMKTNDIIYRIICKNEFCEKCLNLKNNNNICKECYKNKKQITKMLNDCDLEAVNRIIRISNELDSEIEEYKYKNYKEEEDFYRFNIKDEVFGYNTYIDEDLCSECNENYDDCLCEF